MMIVRPDGILPSARRRIQLADPDEPGMDSDPETREEEPGLTVNGDAFADGSGGREEQ